MRKKKNQSKARSPNLARSVRIFFRVTVYVDRDSVTVISRSLHVKTRQHVKLFNIIFFTPIPLHSPKFNRL